MSKNVVPLLWLLLVFSGFLTSQGVTNSPENFQYKIKVGDTYTYKCTKHFISENADSYPRYSLLEIDEFFESIVTNGSTFIVQVFEVAESTVMGVRMIGNQSFQGSISDFVFKITDNRSYYEELSTANGGYKLINETFFKTSISDYYATPTTLNGGSIEIFNKIYGWNWKTGWLEYEYLEYLYNYETKVEIEFVSLPSIEVTTTISLNTTTGPPSSTTSLITTMTTASTTITTTPTTTPSWTIIFMLLSFIAMLPLRRGKKRT